MQTNISEEDRTFETRLIFIKDIFLNKYPNEQIMANCINYKLNMSYESYSRELENDIKLLVGENPIRVLKRID